MAGFSSIIDALGGLDINVGPDPLPVGGITPSGRHVKPDYYIPAGPSTSTAPARWRSPARAPAAATTSAWAASAAC